MFLLKLINMLMYQWKWVVIWYWQRASNGRFKAVEHRAVVNKEKDRLSIVTGLNPNPKAEIGPAAKLVNQLHPALYETRTYADIRATSARGIKW